LPNGIEIKRALISLTMVSKNRQQKVKGLNPKVVGYVFIACPIFFNLKYIFFLKAII